MRDHYVTVPALFPLYSPVQIQTTDAPLKPAKNHLNHIKPDKNQLTLSATPSPSTKNHINHLFRKKITPLIFTEAQQTRDCFAAPKNRILISPALMKTPTLSILAALFISSAFAAPANLFKDQTIDDKIGVGYGLAVADVNGDKKIDILLVDAGEVAWYENPTWKKHVISGKLTERDHVCIAAQDIDGDGKAEIAIGAGWNPGDTENSGAVFYLIPSTDRTQKWTPVQLPHEPTVHRMWWVHVDEGVYSLVVSPLHGRGNKGGAGAGVKLLEYIVPPDVRGKWETRVMEDTMHMTHNLDPVQWDSDRAQEILYGGKEAIMLLDRKDGQWTKTKLIEGNGFLGAGEVRAGKVGPNRIIASIEPMHGTNAVVYTQANDNWQRHVLDATIADGHAVGVGDLLQKKEDQIVFGWRGKNKDGKVGIKMFEKKGDAWEQTWIDDNKMACEDLKVVDLNGDSWLDIVAAGRATKNVKIYWNQSGTR
jgi:hypothetical protein